MASVLLSGGATQHADSGPAVTWQCDDRFPEQTVRYRKRQHLSFSAEEFFAFDRSEFATESTVEMETPVSRPDNRLGDLMDRA